MAVAISGAALSALGVVCFGTFASRRRDAHVQQQHHSGSAATTLGHNLDSLSKGRHEFHEPWVSNKTAQSIMSYLHASYPLILLLFFMTAFTLRSIAATQSEEETDDEDDTPTQLGPGGKPLPRKSPIRLRKDNKLDALDFSRPRKLLFEWLALGATLTFLGNCVTVVAHAIYDREDEWWCGQATVVGLLDLRSWFPD